jgi:outer membrane protein assembly factor BamB
MLRTPRRQGLFGLALVVLGALPPGAARAQDDPKDWPMYNHDVLVYTNVGDPVASGVAVANGVVYFTTVASNKLVALDAATGKVLREIGLGPVWSGPSVSRGRVYVGTGNVLFNRVDTEAFFPKKATGVLYCFGLPGEDEVSRLGAGKE